MRIVLNVISSGQIIDSYDYSEEVFLHNEIRIDVNNKAGKLMHLIALILSFDNYNNSTILNGYHLLLEMGQSKKEYFVDDSNKEEFFIFLNEVKSIEMEEK